MKILSGVLLISYPFTIYFCLKHLATIHIASLFLLIYTLFFIIEKYSGQIILPSKAALFGCIILALTLSAILQKEIFLLFLPIINSINYFILFFSSLFTKQTLVEKFARLKNNDLPVEAIVYCRRVTLMWSIFILINILIAAWTVTQSIEIWLLYNGFISYALIATLMTLEFIFRKWKMTTIKEKQ